MATATTRAKRITPRDRTALIAVLDAAIENSCGCDRGGRGYFGHSRDCWVHTNRGILRRVQAIIDATR